ncbi:helix-turn-helix domain-containing protein [Cronobacter sakazakii]|uniref:transcriptional regulator n=1 Tax=Cronobacter TaxID=413496 RepID=UPI000518A609|nr:MULTISPECIES: helix-turn-helix domain-containing protein [Cronobacter]EGT4273779.1 helix-turn-helix domain-containing protein [Cronobacter sakazakii]EGT4286476.1 helix-turn-helix domain-containing protein [Cronobacter sakazakii]EGT4294951.1 helix-turn-helix domain-containing protein [Cronobacter sakazakii]EJO9549688.1 helix-turn-helix domain-containing protein [Cronobacter sakazakii]EJQ0793509.1 helix-turn-helix domain-containing protein [Cronobacter sakazakii]
MNQVIKTAIAIVGTQKELAKACGVSQAAVQKWLYGKAKVSPQNVASVVKATGGKVQGHEIRPDLPGLFPKPNQAA